MQDFASLRLAELRELAKEQGIKNINSKKKSELVQLLQDMTSAEQPKAAEKKKEVQRAEVKKTHEKAPVQTQASERPNDQTVQARQAENQNERQTERQAERQNDRQNGRRSQPSNRQNSRSGDNDNRSSQANRDSRDSRDNRDIRDSRDNRDNRDNRNNRDNRSVNRRGDQRRDNRGDNRNDTRNDYRNESRADMRNDNRNDNRNDYRNDNRADMNNRGDLNMRFDQFNHYDRAYTENDQYSSRSDQYNNRSDQYGSRYDQLANRYDQDYNHNDQNPQNSQNYDQDDSPRMCRGILETIRSEDGKTFGFVRSENYLTGENDVYVASSQITRFRLKTGDMIEGPVRMTSDQGKKFPGLMRITSINGFDPEEAKKRDSFENLTPIFPNERLHVETKDSNIAMRIMDLFAPIGKGQRGMIVSPPKAGKTTLLKEIAKAVITNNPEVHIIILLIDERPEEVTDIKETIEEKHGNVEVIYSTFDELPEHHKRVSEMVLERAKRIVEHGQDVMILLDSITRLTRAYNLTVQASGRTLSGGLDPAALHFPKKFFGAARNIRDGGSLTILATALVDTGSRMDDVVFEEFKGTGNMEIVLDRKLSERRVFPAIDLSKSSTRRDDLLLDAQEQETMEIVRKALYSMKPEETTERVITTMRKTASNQLFGQIVRQFKALPSISGTIHRD